MKKVFVICLLILCLLINTCVLGEGILPSLEELFEMPMPSLGEALQREPDSVVENEDGSTTEVYTDVKNGDYTAFSQYLQEQGAELADYSVDGSVFTATIQVGTEAFCFKWDKQSGEAEVVYPDGTYDEWLATDRTPAQDMSVGKIVVFGHYEQDGDVSNGAEEIEWIVLDNDGEKALLLSKNGLDAKPYNTEYVDITWEKCTLRSWLNGEFLNAAFSANEQSAIILTDVDNSRSQGNNEWNTNGGNNTQDKVFLLSYNEAGTYFSSDDTRLCVPTDYALQQGAYTNDKYKVDGKATGWWWLRSPGSRQHSAAYVSDGGSRDYYYVDCDVGMIRPALWINLDSGIF